MIQDFSENTSIECIYKLVKSYDGISVASLWFQLLADVYPDS